MNSNCKCGGRCQSVVEGPWTPGPVEAAYFNMLIALTSEEFRRIALAAEREGADVHNYVKARALQDAPE